MCLASCEARSGDLDHQHQLGAVPMPADAWGGFRHRDPWTGQARYTGSGQYLQVGPPRQFVLEGIPSSFDSDPLLPGAPLLPRTAGPEAPCQVEFPR